MANKLIRPESLGLLSIATLKAVHDRIIIKPLAETETTSGIMRPALDGCKFGEVISVGKGKLLDNGKYKAPEVRVGDKVMVNQFSELQNEDGVFWVVTERDILGIVE